MGPIMQAKHTAHVLIGEARARRLVGHGFWSMFRMAQSARRRAAALPRPSPPGPAGTPRPTGAICMICSIGAAWLAIKGDREKYLDFLYFGMCEFLIELLALGVVLETSHG